MCQGRVHGRRGVSYSPEDERERKVDEFSLLCCARIEKKEIFWDIIMLRTTRNPPSRTGEDKN